MSTVPKKRTADPEKLTWGTKALIFFSVHWRGVVVVLAPIICSFILFTYSPIQKAQWCAYCLLIMAVYWVTECIPLPVTAFLPIIIFPLTNIMDTATVCKFYLNDTLFMFIGSMILAYSIEQSGLHMRIALGAIRCIGYSHYKLLLAICLVTMIISMWITNTAATVMVVPIVFALLKVFEDQGLMTIYETTSHGERVASDLTTCYFCSVTFSATIGGIGTLVGTATNLAFKGLFMEAYKEATVEYLSFIHFSAFAVPYMILMEIALYFYMILVYFGFLRPKSKAARGAVLNDQAIQAAKNKVESDWKALGRITFWEIMVILLFSFAIALFFCRSPQIFHGWGDAIRDYFGYTIKEKPVKDSAAAFLVGFLMCLLPYSMQIIDNFTAKYHEDLPKKPIRAVLDWRIASAVMPFSFMFLLGGGFALSTAARPAYTDLNGEIAQMLNSLRNLPNYFIIFILIVVTTFITNFASNVAVANVICPIAMQLAKEIGQNPLWYNIACGFSASYCFLLPVGTPGNLIVQSAASVPVGKMIIAGAGPTVSTILLTWLAMCFWAPVVWPVLLTVPDWVKAV
ncbi:protein I'm not dead yet [Plutella xylostella]|uniref:protein I'm not dead yet n=1 Tax=Plutella xylostella TaxID=51655 RepID=UPI0018D19251|nr:protein I'm not dead yet [Plutella xylostella]